MIAKRWAVASALAAGISLLLSGCGSTEKFRYKMTVEVETPQGVKTGYAVREVTVSTGDNLARVASAGLKGEAVAVDVFPGKTLFALLTSADGDMDYSINVSRIAWPGVYLPQLREKTQPVVLWPSAPKRTWAKNALSYPMLVTFGDVRDPKSVELVTPASLDQAFGAGVRLKRITVRATDEDVTAGIGKRLRWLGKYPEPSLDPAHGPKDFSIAASTHHGDFRMGTEQ